MMTSDKERARADEPTQQLADAQKDYDSQPGTAPPQAPSPLRPACGNEQARVNDLLDEYLDAQADCNQGIKGQCGRAAILLRQLTSARNKLRICLNS